MKPKTKRLFSKSLSIFLAILMALYVVPLTAFAQTDADIPDDTAISDIPLVSGTEETEETVAEDTYVLGEVESLRTDSTKHFRMSDGSYVAVEYGKKVHFKDDNDDWQDFDNTLSLQNAINTDNIKGYASSKNDVKIKLANNRNSSSIVKINDGDYSIGLNLIGSSKKNTLSKAKSNDIFKANIQEDKIFVANTEEKKIDSGKKLTIEEATKLTKYSSSVTYADILPNTDLEYIIYGNNLKENIIVKAKSDSYVYEFDLNLKGLTPELNEDGSISLYDNASKEIIFTIPAGYMFDANGVASNEVEYSLVKNDDNTYTLVVTADTSWINADDRAFPITVDPTVWRTNSTKESNIKDAYVTAAEPNLNTGLWAWSYSGYNSGYEYISLVGIKELPNIPKASVVTDAKLGMYVLSYSSQVNIGAYAVKGSWESHSTTWATKPNIDTSTVLDYQKVSASTNINDPSTAKYFDITSITQDWYSGLREDEGIVSANGIALKALLTSTERVKFSTANNSHYNQSYPIFIVSYRDTKGLEGRWSYTSHSAGNAGTGHVNDFTGNLVFAHNDISTNGSILPISVSHVFNTYLANTDFTYNSNTPLTASFTNMKVGKGWKLSVQETIIEVPLNNDTWFCYSDADGTELYFNDFITPGKYISEDGYGLTITKNTSSTTERYTMSDDYGNKKTFNSSGYITYIRDIMGNQKSFVYSSNRLTSIKYKPAGSSSYITQLTFSYNANNALYRVTNAQNTSEYVEYYYSTTYSGSYSKSNAGYLRKIQYSNGKCSYYEYLSDGALNYVLDGDTNARVAYSYSIGNSQINNKTKRIATVSEWTVSYSLGQKIGFIYDYKKTSIRTRGKDDVYGNSDDILTTYLFDNSGRTICAYSSNLTGDTIYGTSNAEYDNNVSDGSKKTNTITKDSVAGTPAINYVKNSGAESLTDWSTSVTNSSVQSAMSSSNDKFLGAKSFKAYNNDVTGMAKFYQNVAIPSAGTYTLSAYVKTTSIAGSDGAYLKLGGSISKKIIGVTRQSVQDGWQRISVTNTFSSSGNYTAELIWNCSVGTAYFDCIQLEKGKAPSKYNIIRNGSFELQQDWSLIGGSYVNDTDHGKVMSFTGNANGSRYAYQGNALNVPSNTTFVLSGWAKANSASLDDSSRVFELEARIRYSDNSYDYQFVKFNPDYTGWQFASSAIVPTKSGLTIASITILCKYYKNVNKAYFDNISLTMEPAQTYAYDDNGNMLNVKDALGNKDESKFYDNDIDIKSYTNILGEKYEYTYATVNGINTHFVKKAKKTSLASKTITTEYEYDNYGNVISSKVTSSGSSDSITSSTAYKNNGNYVDYTTDARGNKTYYNVDMAKDLLKYVLDANGTRIGYEYDSRNRASSTYYDENDNCVRDSNEKNVQYTYENNRLSEIITSGTTYNLNYDIYGNKSSIGITGMSNKLASYIYNSNNGKLSKTTYGNGFYVENVYDELDRVIEIKYNGSKKFTFIYNVSGQLYSSTDYINSTVYNYEYDSFGRLIRATQKTLSGSLVISTENEFDSKGRASKSRYILPDKTLEYEIAYNNNSSLVSTYNLPSDENITYTYDAFDRLETKDLNNVYSVTYTYMQGINSTKTTALVSEIKINPDGSTTDTKYKYEYDAVGNITKVYENNVLKLSYTYDALGQLTREYNYYSNEIFSYTYNDAGNITSKTRSIIDHYEPPTITTYSYSDTTWRDLLTNITVTWNYSEVLSDTTISYDAIGNPTNWQNIAQLVWKGRRLSYITIDGLDDSVSYTYNSKGIRTRKHTWDSFGETDFSYILDGSNIIKETRSGVQNATLYYYYDDSGVCGFNYNGTDYYYGKNLQGDITKIYNDSGVEIVSYAYDAWGKILSMKDGSGNALVSGTTAHTIANANPFRYRGYYYDNETGWYYLNSRYYDPNVGRFISADAIIGANGGLQGYNMFAYCNNNPIMGYDPSGYHSFNYHGLMAQCPYEYNEDPLTLYWDINELVGDNNRYVKSNCIKHRYIALYYTICANSNGKLINHIERNKKIMSQTSQKSILDKAVVTVVGLKEGLESIHALSTDINNEISERLDNYFKPEILDQPLVSNDLKGYLLKGADICEYNAKVYSTIGVVSAPFALLYPPVIVFTKSTGAVAATFEGLNIAFRVIASWL